MLLLNGCGCVRLEDHFANEVAAAASQKPRAERREERVFAPLVVVRVPAIQRKRTPEAVHAVTLTCLVEARFRKLLEARAREVHTCSTVQVDESLLARAHCHRSRRAGSVPIM